jgi:hypothetical protein
MPGIVVPGPLPTLPAPHRRHRLLPAWAARGRGGAASGERLAHSRLPTMPCGSLPLTLTGRAGGLVFGSGKKTSSGSTPAGAHSAPSPSRFRSGATAEGERGIVEQVLHTAAGVADVADQSPRACPGARDASLDTRRRCGERCPLCGVKPREAGSLAARVDVTYRDGGDDHCRAGEGSVEPTLRRLRLPRRRYVLARLVLAARRHECQTVALTGENAELPEASIQALLFASRK